MPTPFEAIKTEVLELPLQERTELIHHLVASVEPAMPLHPDWGPEIARRIAALDAGREAVLDGKQVLADMRARIESSKGGRP